MTIIEVNTANIESIAKNDIERFNANERHHFKIVKIGEENNLKYQIVDKDEVMCVCFSPVNTMLVALALEDSFKDFEKKCMVFELKSNNNNK